MNSHEEQRMELQRKWDSILDERSTVWIYGAGIVGKRIYELMKAEKRLDQLEGFVVSKQKADEPKSIEDKKIILVDDLEDKNSNILVAVGDAYQNEILHLLKEKGFSSAINVYIYSFLREEHIPMDLPEEVPETILMDIGELMVQQWKDGKFCRYDILRQLVSIQELENVEEFNSNFEFNVDQNMKLCNGTNEIVLALYHHVSEIKIHQQYEATKEYYGDEWLKQNSSDEEYKKIKKMLEEFTAEWSNPFVGIMWPPAEELFDEITEEVARLVNVKNVTDIRVPGHTFEEFVKGVYSTDDVEEWKIETKLERMKMEGDYPIRILEIYMDSPEFRIKRHGHTVSKTGVALKNKIREKYKECIPNYINDVIMHTTDNYQQSREVKNLLEKLQLI